MQVALVLVPYFHTCFVMTLWHGAQGALPGLVGLLKRYVPFMGPPNTGASVVRRAADAITNLAHENVVIKSKVRAEGGIPPLVCLLESYDAKVRCRRGRLGQVPFHRG